MESQSFFILLCFTRNIMMRGVALTSFGGVEVMKLVDNLPIPKLQRPNDILLHIKATAVNRADLMQRRGHYPPPPGASDILGLEASGIVESIGSGVTLVQPGQRVMAILSGGGYAEKVLVPERHVLPIPSDSMTFEEAAAIPEAFLTAWQCLKFQTDEHNRLMEGHWVLIHAGASGVGTAAAQLCKLLHCTSITTSSQSKVAECRKYADFAVSRTPDPVTGKCFQSKVEEEVSGGNKLQRPQSDDPSLLLPNSQAREELNGGRTEFPGVKLIIDPVVGGTYLEEDCQLLAMDGTIVVLAMMGGATITTPFQLSTIFRKRGTIKFSTLRNRCEEYKASLVESFRKEALPSFVRGRNKEGEMSAGPLLRAVVDQVMKMEDVKLAHSLLENNETVGKVVLTWT